MNPGDAVVVPLVTERLPGLPTWRAVTQIRRSPWWPCIRSDERCGYMAATGKAVQFGQARR